MTFAKKSPQFELRVLISSILQGAISYKGAIVPVFETIPKGMPLPYVCLGDCTWNNQATKDFFEDDYTLELYVFTGYGGTMDNIAILGVVFEALSDAAINGTMQFADTSNFCIQLFTFGNGSTSLLAEEGLARRVREELERSLQELVFTIKQNN